MEYFDKRESEENCHGSEIVDEVYPWLSKDTEKPTYSVCSLLTEINFTHMSAPT
jgi:hypothetical protein